MSATHSFAFAKAAGLLLSVCLFSSLCNIMAFNRTHPKRGGSSLTIQESFKSPYSLTIVTIGDLHGDLPATYDVLHSVNIIDEDHHWNPNCGVDVVVQLGDVLDRGDDGIQIIRYFEILSKEADEHGALFYTVLGNHEALNLFGDWAEVSWGDMKKNGGVYGRQKLFMAGGDIGQALLDHYPFTIRIPLHPALGGINTDFDIRDVADFGNMAYNAIGFVHGGFDLDTDYGENFPSDINEAGEDMVKYLLSRKNPAGPTLPGQTSPGFPPDMSELDAMLLSDNTSPLWYRGWAENIDRVNFCPDAFRMLNKLGLRRLVMGHTVQKKGATQLCNGRLVLADTGISSNMLGMRSAVKMQYSLTPVDYDKGVYEERDTITAIYQDGEMTETLLDVKRNLQLSQFREAALRQQEHASSEKDEETEEVDEVDEVENKLTGLSFQQSNEVDETDEEVRMIMNASGR